MVRVAKLDCEVIEKEAEIWEDDFLDSADPFCFSMGRRFTARSYIM